MRDKLGLKNPQDWQKLTCESIRKAGGSSFLYIVSITFTGAGILRCYGSSPRKALISNFPGKTPAS